MRAAFAKTLDPRYLAGMQTDHNSPDAVALETLRRVRDPDAFVQAFRLAHKEEQLRRRQFIDDLSPDVKAEWIDGEAIYHSPAREIHNLTTHGLDNILGNFSLFRERLRVRVEKAMIELEHDNFEPDLCVWRAADHTFDRELVLYPRPDLAIEVLSPRTRNRDLGKKKKEYAIAGTYEYWVVDTDSDTLTLFKNLGQLFDDGTIFGVQDRVVSSWLPALNFPLDAVWEDDVRQAWTREVVGGAEH